MAPERLMHYVSILYTHTHKCSSASSIHQQTRESNIFAGKQ